MVAAAKGVFLRAASTSAGVERDQRLAIGTLGVLVFHMSVQGWVRQVGLVTEGALVVAPMDIVFAPPLLLFLAGSFVASGRVLLAAIRKQVFFLRIFRFLRHRSRSPLPSELL